MRRLLILLTGSALLACLGCAGTKATALNGGPWPKYEEPAPLAFTDEEKTALSQFAHEHPELFTKIQGQSHAYRAMVREHNKLAIEHNRFLMKALGFNEAVINAAYPLPADEATLGTYKPKPEEVKKL